MALKVKLISSKGGKVCRKIDPSHGNTITPYKAGWSQPPMLLPDSDPAVNRSVHQSSQPVDNRSPSYLFLAYRSGSICALPTLTQPSLMVSLSTNK